MLAEAMADKVAEQPRIGTCAVEELRVGDEGLFQGEAGPASVPAGGLTLPQLVPQRAVLLEGLALEVILEDISVQSW